MCRSHGIPFQPLFPVINFNMAHFVSIHITFLNIVLKPYLEGNTFISWGEGKGVKVLTYADGSEAVLPLSCISVVAGQDLGIHQPSLSLSESLGWCCYPILQMSESKPGEMD